MHIVVDVAFAHAVKLPSHLSRGCCWVDALGGVLCSSVPDYRFFAAAGAGACVWCESDSLAIRPDNPIHLSRSSLAPRSSNRQHVFMSTAPAHRRVDCLHISSILYS